MLVDNLSWWGSDAGAAVLHGAMRCQAPSLRHCMHGVQLLAVNMLKQGGSGNSKGAAHLQAVLLFVILAFLARRRLGEWRRLALCHVQLHLRLVLQAAASQCFRNFWSLATFGTKDMIDVSCTESPGTPSQTLCLLATLLHS